MGSGLLESNLSLMWSQQSFFLESISVLCLICRRCFLCKLGRSTSWSYCSSLNPRRFW